MSELSYLRSRCLTYPTSQTRHLQIAGFVDTRFLTFQNIVDHFTEFRPRDVILISKIPITTDEIKKKNGGGNGINSNNNGD